MGCATGSMTALGGDERYKREGGRGSGIPEGEEVNWRDAFFFFIKNNKCFIYF